MGSNWSDMSAALLGKGIGDGQIDPVDLADYFLEAINTEPAAGEIYVVVTVERARWEALAARQRANEGRRQGPLDGVPVSWKDLYDSAGDLTQSGTPLLRGRIPEEDAQVLNLATKAGMVCLGKTHQTEFAFSGLGINPNTATPPNKDFPGCVPGGSSSGAAASIVHGLAPLAIGSDTGGSVRIPAAWNSLVGLKPTYGVISTKGVVPLCPGFDTVGPLAKTVEDASLMFEVMGGGKVSLNELPDLAQLSFIVLENIALERCDSLVLESFEQTIDALTGAGVTIERRKLPDIDDMLELSIPLFTFEAWHAWGELITNNPGIVYPPVEKRFLAGASISSAENETARKKLEILQRQIFGDMENYNGILTPTTAIMPPNIAALFADEALFTATNLLTLRNARIGNLLGTCALSLPTAVKGIGLQLIGKPMQDAALLQIGAVLENIARS